MLRRFVLAALIGLAMPALAAAEDEHHDRGHPPPRRTAPAHPAVVAPPHAVAHPGGGQFSYGGHMINRVRIHPFIYPPGLAYRRWAVGAVLPPVLLVRDYWYPDWAALGLPAPQPGYEWLRFGPDLLLVDIATGQVIDVAYGVFYD